MQRAKREGWLGMAILGLLVGQTVWAAGKTPEPAKVAPPAEAKGVIVYLGMGIADGVSVKKELRPVIEAELVKVIEMDRYQILVLDPKGPMSVDDLTDQLGALRADPPPDPKPAWADQLDQIKAAAYVCELYLTGFDVTLDEVRAGQKAVVAISATLDFYKLDLSDPEHPKARHSDLVGKVVPVTYTGMLREQGSLDAQLRPLIRRAAKGLAAYLTLQLRQLPAFELQAKLLRADGDKIWLPMGKTLGVELNDAFIIRKRTPSGPTRQVAYARVRSVEPDKSQAEIVATYGDWSYGGDEIAVEDDRSGISVGAAAVLEYTGLDLFGNGGPGFYPGINLTFSSDLSASVDWPEFYLSVDLDYLSVGMATAVGMGVRTDVHLGHATIGLAKKWTFGRLALQAGLRAGFAYYIYSESGVVEEGPAAHLGFGGDLLFGTEVFLAPWASLGLRLVGRYFTNPIDWVAVPYDEIALRLEAGIQFAF